MESDVLRQLTLSRSAPPAHAVLAAVFSRNQGALGHVAKRTNAGELGSECRNPSCIGNTPIGALIWTRMRCLCGADLLVTTTPSSIPKVGPVRFAQVRLLMYG